MAKRKRGAQNKRVGKLIQCVGWMSEKKKNALVEAIKKHPFIDGQSDFINKAAEALISQTEHGCTLAQPLCFITADERDALAALKFVKK